ncbi:hypothetical protein SNK19_22665 [Ralstonia pseudosolanacearum]|uniref:hypothetical protein n=1 Tax=Ralstonia pseudosolanacearum TaxID=1310165 RepID=UPI003CF2C8E5
MPFSATIIWILTLAIYFFFPMMAIGEEDVPVRLIGPDQYALRRATVRRTDGGELLGILSLSFERQMSTWILKTAREGELRFPMSEVAEIKFTQSDPNAQSVAQVCLDTIIAEPQGSKRLTLRPGELRIEQNTLLLRSGDVKPIIADSKLEAEGIAYDETHRMYVVTLQVVVYQRKKNDCGRGIGGGGGGKYMR